MKNIRKGKTQENVTKMVQRSESNDNDQRLMPEFLANDIIVRIPPLFAVALNVGFLEYLTRRGMGRRST